MKRRRPTNKAVPVNAEERALMERAARVCGEDFGGWARSILLLAARRALSERGMAA